MRCLPIHCVGRGTSCFGCYPAVQEKSHYKTSRFITDLTEPTVGPAFNYMNNYLVLFFFIWAFDILSNSVLSAQLLITLVTKTSDCTPSQTRTLFVCLYIGIH